MPARNALLVAARWPLHRIPSCASAPGPTEPGRWLPVQVDSPAPIIVGALHAPNRVYTWYSPNADNGFRLDQAFLSPCLTPLLQGARHQWGGGSRRAGVSDHAAVIVDI